MEEEPNLDVDVIANFLSEHCWQQHQVVVVNPNQVAIQNISCNDLGEQPVYRLIR